MKILFLCVANSARSQMAEGLAKKIFGDKDEILSAGSNPSFVNPLAIRAMEEIGIDISRQFSKSVNIIDLTAVDYIITLCANAVCPDIAAERVTREHWPLSDPAAPHGTEIEQLQQFRKTRDLLETRITELKLRIQPRFKSPKLILV